MNWVKIHGFENYEISSEGDVLSLSRKVIRKTKHGDFLKTVRSRLLKPALTAGGYRFVTLRKNGKGYNKRIHQLVAYHFIGKRPNGLVTHHIDGDKTNNSVSNLEYISKQKNTQKYYESIGKLSGTIPYNEIPAIIKKIDAGVQCKDVAKQYNVKRNDVAVICKIISLTGEELERKSTTIKI